MGANVNQKQIGGTHYQKLDPAPWDVILKWNLGYLEGTALKYIARWRDKGGLDDIRKAIHFLEKLLEVETEKSQGQHTVDKTVQVSEKYPFPFPPVEEEKCPQKRTITKTRKTEKLPRTYILKYTPPEEKERYEQRRAARKAKKAG